MKPRKGERVRFNYFASETTGKLIRDFSEENDISYNDSIDHFVELGLKLRRPLPKSYEINDKKIRAGLDDLMKVVEGIGTEDDVRECFEEISSMKTTLSSILDILEAKGLRR